MQGSSISGPPIRATALTVLARACGALAESLRVGAETAIRVSPPQQLAAGIWRHTCMLKDVMRRTDSMARICVGEEGENRWRVAGGW